MFTVYVRDIGKCIRHVDQLLRYSGGSVVDNIDNAAQANQSLPPPPAPVSAPSPRPMTFSPAPAPTAQALQPSSPCSPMSLSRPDAIENIDQDINEPLDIASDNDFYECDDNNVGGEETDRPVPESETLSSAPAGPASGSAPASPAAPLSPAASADSQLLRPRAQQQLAQSEQPDNQSDPVPRRSAPAAAPALIEVLGRWDGAGVSTHVTLKKELAEKYSSANSWD
ncbi:uncharacterized protein LOC133527906 [Cydia pomonella]|uniref:uncharacterized protein LOC133527906 n=1 Tax=Cydia pomonella TaxID=82600 RepID=UPI002ADE486C|nr:uncharacterized protein LOC133527906 [Cydia pomonella]